VAAREQRRNPRAGASYRPVWRSRTITRCCARAIASASFAFALPTGLDALQLELLQEALVAHERLHRPQLQVEQRGHAVLQHGVVGQRARARDRSGRARPRGRRPR
jgi:hypothetical protein